MSNHSQEKTNSGSWLNNLSAWDKLAGIIFGLTSAVTLWLLGTVISLNMLPTLYLGVVIVLVVLFLFAIFKTLFANKKKDKKGQESAGMIRLLGLVLALALVLVDAVGISMVSKLHGTLTNIGNDGEEVVYEIVGLYVRNDDSAQKLEDVAAYSTGYSYAYDRDTMETAMEKMTKSVENSLDFKQFESDLVAVDALLAGEVNAVLLNVGYISVMEGLEGYIDIDSRIRLVHEFQMVDEDANNVIINEDTKPKDITEEPFIVYVSGNDSNYSSKKQRSDVNILAVVNPVTKQVVLINTPRDYYVELVGSGKGDGKRDKLTHCGNFGVECSMLTLGELYDQDIHYYARINFKGFTNMVDAVGGVTVYSEKEFRTYTGALVKKGDNYMDGETALSFVRERYAFADGDNARGRHQMAVIKAIIKKAASGAIITRYGDILDAMGSSFSTNLTNEEMSNLVKMQLGDMASWNIQSFSVLGKGNGGKEYTFSIPNQKVYVAYVNDTYVDHAKSLIDKVFAGEEITEADLTIAQ